MQEIKSKSIILIGYKASGKTTLGKALANHLNFTFVDLDQFFLDTYGVSPAIYYKEHGEAKFRTLEKEVLKRVSILTQTVIATGGGIVEDESNIEYLKKLGTLIYIQVDFTTIIARLQQLGRIPEFVDNHHFNARELKYLRACDELLHLDAESIEMSLMKLMKKLGDMNGK